MGRKNETGTRSGAFETSDDVGSTRLKFIQLDRNLPVRESIADKPGKVDFPSRGVLCRELDDPLEQCDKIAFLGFRKMKRRRAHKSPPIM